MDQFRREGTDRGAIRMRETGAVFSDCERYRYALWRNFGPLLGGGKGQCCFVMLNPSTADAEKDDPTIRRCIRYAEGWGYDGLAVLNVFAWRATNPYELPFVDEPTGPLNGQWFAEVLGESAIVIAAWGAHAGLRGGEDRALQWIKFAGKEVHALAALQNGSPAHPLYLPKTLAPRPLAELAIERRRGAGSKRRRVYSATLRT